MTAAEQAFTEYLESQEFHELCMDYRSAGINHARDRFEALQQSIDAAFRAAAALTSQEPQ